MQSVLSSFFSRSCRVYQEVVLKMSEELGNQLRMETDSKIKREMRQRLDALLVTVLKSKPQVSLSVPRTEWTALLGPEMAHMIEKRAHRVRKAALSEKQVC